MLKTLNQQFDLYHREESLRNDPLFLLDRGLPPADQEIISFLIAGLAYGRVEQIQKSGVDLIRRLALCGIGITGESISSALRSPEFMAQVPEALRGWKHRLNTADDLIKVLEILGSVLRSHGSLFELMKSLGEKNPEKRLIRFSQTLLALEKQKRSPSRKNGWKGTGPSWFFANPEDGSTCKRLMMWLRWVVRKNEIDPGVWQHFGPELPIQAAELFVPLDAHIFRWARDHSITALRSPNWKAVLEVTRYFQSLDAADPLRYEFSIFQASFTDFRKKTPPKEAL
jgi:uncharacterized protein (TIGR02757 family)